MLPAILFWFPAVSWRFSLERFLGLKWWSRRQQISYMGHRDSPIQDGYDGGVFLMKSVKFCAEGREIWPPATRFRFHFDPFCSLASWSTAQGVCLWLGQSIPLACFRFLMTCTRLFQIYSIGTLHEISPNEMGISNGIQWEYRNIHKMIYWDIPTAYPIISPMISPSQYIPLYPQMYIQFCGYNPLYPRIISRLVALKGTCARARNPSAFGWKNTWFSVDLHLHHLTSTHLHLNHLKSS